MSFTLCGRREACSHADTNPFAASTVATTTLSTVFDVPDEVPTFASLATPTPDEALDKDLGFELDMINNYDQVAFESFVYEYDYQMAEQCLNKRLRRASGTALTDPAIRTAEIRLAMCHYFQQQWGAAANLLCRLAKDMPEAKDTGHILHLLHGVAIGLLLSGEFGEAEKYCKLALQGKSKLWGRTSKEYCNTLSLLVKIADKKGDPVEARALRLTFPPHSSDQSDHHHVTGVEYLASYNHIKLVEDIWCTKQPSGACFGALNVRKKLKRPVPVHHLQEPPRWHSPWRLLETMKEVVSIELGDHKSLDFDPEKEAWQTLGNFQSQRGISAEPEPTTDARLAIPRLLRDSALQHLIPYSVMIRALQPETMWEMIRYCRLLERCRKSQESEYVSLAQENTTDTYKEVVPEVRPEDWLPDIDSFKEIVPEDVDTFKEVIGVHEGELMPDPVFVFGSTRSRSSRQPAVTFEDLDLGRQEDDEGQRNHIPRRHTTIRRLRKMMSVSRTFGEDDT